MITYLLFRYQNHSVFCWCTNTCKFWGSSYRIFCCEFREFNWYCKNKSEKWFRFLFSKSSLHWRRSGELIGLLFLSLSAKTHLLFAWFVLLAYLYTNIHFFFTVGSKCIICYKYCHTIQAVCSCRCGERNNVENKHVITIGNSCRPWFNLYLCSKFSEQSASYTQ